MLNPRLKEFADYPFRRLHELLEGVAPPAGVAPTFLSIGEPRHAPPEIIRRTLAANADLWGKYPPIDGTAEFRAAVGGWLIRRFGLKHFDPDARVLPCAGTREALYMLAQLIVPELCPRPESRSVVVLPNPFYHVYAGAALMAGADVVALAGTEESGFLPDLKSLDEETLERTSLVYLCSPANPSGAVAGMEYLKDAIRLARKYDFVLAVDECYSEIYSKTPPAGALAAAEQLGATAGGGVDSGDSYANVMVFHSLSKRSSAAGLRSGFVAGDGGLIAAFRRLRTIGGPTVSLPVLAASAALWRDEAHVEESRARYRAKFDVADEILGRRFGYARPAGGFFLWLDVSECGISGEEATLKLWRDAGLRVLPGAYMARTGPDGGNPARNFIRAALVDDPDTVRKALKSLTEVLSSAVLLRSW